MTNNTFSDKITKHYNDLHDHYRKVASMVKYNNELRSYADKNISAYNESSELFQTLDIIMKGEDDLDIINRTIHFTSIQYDVCLKLEDYLAINEIEYKDKFLEGIKDIKSILVDLIKMVTSVIDLEAKTNWVLFSTWITKQSMEIFENMTDKIINDTKKERDQLLEHIEKMYSIMSHIQKLVEKSDKGD